MMLSASQPIENGVVPFSFRQYNGLANKEYGLWQDYGTGRNCRWFSRKYYATMMNIKEFYEENIGREFCGILIRLGRDFGKK